MPARKKTSKKSPGKKTGVKKRPLTKTKKATIKKKHSRAKRTGTVRKPSRGVRRRESRYGVSRTASQGSASQSGDLQGLSDIERADSESVDELLEEGNAFEAEAVYGVENAQDPDLSEVRTHEVPEDDVPAEYLDNED